MYCLASVLATPAAISGLGRREPHVDQPAVADRAHRETARGTRRSTRDCAGGFAGAGKCDLAAGLENRPVTHPAPADCRRDAGGRFFLRVAAAEFRRVPQFQRVDGPARQGPALQDCILRLVSILVSSTCPADHFLELHDVRVLRIEQQLNAAFEIGVAVYV